MQISIKTGVVQAIVSSLWIFERIVELKNTELQVSVAAGDCGNSAPYDEFLLLGVC
jgi:hypothetical protein